MTDPTDSISLLYVDDLSSAELTATRLEQENARFGIETATTVRSGLTRLAAGDFDCVVSGHDAPGLDGLDFLHAVRAESPNLPFILYTGKGSEELASDAISAGVTDYLQKERGTGQYAVLANRIENAVDQSRSHTALEATEQRLTSFVDQSPLGILEYNSDFEIVRLNGAGEEILGYTEAELRGQTWEVLVTDNSYDDVETVTEMLSNATGGYHSIDENVRKDGTRIVCEWHNRLVTDETGDVVAVFSQFQDVTERRRREENLRETTARLTALFEESPDMINVHTLDGDIVDPNPHLCEKTGYDAAELTDMKVWDVDANADPDGVRAMWEAMEQGERRRLEGSYRHRDGSTFPVEVHVRRLNLDGEDQFLVISRDISERKQRERQLKRQNDRLNEFASVVSHDLRNPLNVAAGRIELAQEETKNEHLVPAASAIDRCNALIDDLLTLARHGKDLGDVEPVSLHPVVHHCWQHVETGDATLHTDVTRTVVADRSQLQQLVENLLRNSIDHGGSDVTVTVEDSPDGFAVADDGPGIPESERETVFDAGYSTARDGTGFGLRIVEQIAEAHGWTTRVTESADGGARFEISNVEFADADTR